MPGSNVLSVPAEEDSSDVCVLADCVAEEEPDDEDVPDDPHPIIVTDNVPTANKEISSLLNLFMTSLQILSPTCMSVLHSANCHEYEI